MNKTLFALTAAVGILVATVATSEAASPTMYKSNGMNGSHSSHMGQQGYHTSFDGYKSFHYGGAIAQPGIVGPPAGLPQ